MNTIWGAELNYAPDYWPLWLVYAGIIVLLFIAGLLLHALLRRFLAPKAAEDGIEVREYLYPLYVRCWHWGNALLFILLLLTGLAGHFTVGSVPFMVEVHRICGFVLVAFWFVFVLINLFSRNGQHYRVRLAGMISRCFLQIRYYLYGIMKGEPHPFEATETQKFNPLQQLGYLAIMYLLVPLLIITGLLCLWPVAGFGGPMMLMLHFALGIAGLMFICVHIYLCTLGDTPAQIFRSMIDGYHRHRSHERQER
ncbi:thiosulfate reductase cytochrome B subunit [Trabulsiella guamensis ATCC 49490]|uniref:Thiosulfate reductase cytochrome B subunit n=1 Tax=Trabulsiella guamensis ATCC 49490 TaxID=1005994 RepID=A0A084ZSD9_9ENTR|nr:thiosulfate reductase cytochrome B subunit [Trabulsiella guamensis]KFC00384.1 thiosulfate reductase cytochrome B subunit [Trabulsiella guamensis ATCC 49490]